MLRLHLFNSSCTLSWMLLCFYQQRQIFIIFATSGSYRQTSRQTAIWAISPNHLHTSHPLLIIAVLLNWTNWWLNIHFVCFLSIFHFPSSFYVLACWYLKEKINWSISLDVSGGEEVCTESYLEFGINTNRHSRDKQGKSSRLHSYPLRHLDDNTAVQSSTKCSVLLEKSFLLMNVLSGLILSDIKCTYFKISMHSKIKTPWHIPIFLSQMSL